MIFGKLPGYGFAKKKPKTWVRYGFVFSPLFGEDFQFDEHIFSDGLKNHQLVNQLFKIYIVCISMLWLRPRNY